MKMLCTILVIIVSLLRFLASLLVTLELQLLW